MLIGIIILGVFLVWAILLKYKPSNENELDNNITYKNELIPYPKYAQTDEDIKLILNNITVISKKISEIKQKLYILIENNKLLKNDMNNEKEIIDMINKNNEIIYYLNDLYDQYVAINLELFFSGLTFYLQKEDIKTIKIKDKIEKLNKDMEDQIYKYFPKDKPINQIIECFKISGKTINEIFDNINTIKIKLILLQNKAVISNISPIEIEKELNLIISDKDYSKIYLNLDELNNAYDKFISEYEVTEGLERI